MVRLAGFEPATYGLEVRCSIRAELQAHNYFAVYPADIP